MKLTEEIVFPPFRLDPANEQLWREHQLVPLPPKTFAVLRFLVEHAGQLVTKEKLLKGVWPETRVSEGILKGYIRDLRDILGDDSRQPSFIETVPRRGHRFIAPLATSPHSRLESRAQGLASESQGTALFGQTLNPRRQTLDVLMVGRDTELAHLHTLFAKALRGERQIVFVTGEPGIGKTTLVEAFLFGVQSRERFRVQNSEPRTLNTELPLTSDPWLGRGQCVEQHGAGEAYLPVLEALGRIGRAPGGEQFVAMLHQHAPTWLVQMPALLAAEELETLQQRVVGATRERMLRELVEAVEALTADRPLVLWFEDLHWADASTVDWLAAVAHRGAPARLLVIGTYRPSDLSLSGHPLKAVKQELVAKRQCEELWLPFLSADDVTHYLTRRYTQHQFPSGLGTAIHRRTDGNPLFIVNMVGYLAAQGVIAEVANHWRLQTAVEEVGRGVPESLRQLIEKHIERLSEEHQRLLEVASIVGVTFSATAVAAGTEASVEQIEEWCEGLVKRGQFLQVQEPRLLPDGTLDGSYQFLHALYQAVLYERIPTTRRLRLHRRVGDGQERLYGARAQEIAAELAVHFERGGNLPRAVQYLLHAGKNAVRRSAHQEAIAHFSRGLDLLATLPDTPERRQYELALQAALGVPLLRTKGYAAPEIAHAYGRARELCQQIGEQPELFTALVGLCSFYLARAELQTAGMLAEQCLRLAQRAQDSALLVEAHFILGVTLFSRGKLTNAHAILEQGSAFYDPQVHRSLTVVYGQDPGVGCRSYASLVSWYLGYPDQALGKSHDALSLARELSHSFSVGAALHTASWVRQYRQERQAVQAYAEEELVLSKEEGFALWLAVGRIQRGWALSEQGDKEQGLAQMREGIAALNATGAKLSQPYHLALLAQVYGKSGQPHEGSVLLDQALAAVDKTGERYYETELYRLKGELLLQQESQKSKACPACACAAGTGESGRRGKVQKSKVPTPRPLIPDPQGEAEACFLQALDIARRQEAKSLELRAAMSLVRLRQQQASEQRAENREQGARNRKRGTRSTQHGIRNRLDEAHKMLSEVYHWFTEGFDTKDLQDAKALLEERKRQKG